ncbi:uncharacterized protein A4U43_C08F9150 [Asparagus officinalis]|uniref:5'-adenylylsulfate reductase-like 5 isoform X2 n=1 Tax=Asparagus officinalis TaxID=4686 RepID=UPI00098E143A|nr:5'-adenylylsulfate reductase-like 5 isoform X2 [Asparagus officinalis]ONK59675.1 uncharacterized protein A4U43_C08F9150 [Asparagus officinalis]
MDFFLRFLSILFIVFLSVDGSVADSSRCPRSGVDSFVHGVQSQCPIWIERCSPEQVNGDRLDRELGHAQGNAYYSILFHASWCPFSREIQPTFDALSSMFPQIRHLTIEESSAMPSVFSRYGIHSFPSILIANRTAKMQYHGPKNLNSLVEFYKATTGFDPVAYLSVEEPPSSESRMPFNLRDHSLREIIVSERYLAFSLAFICLKAFLSFFPVIISRIKAFFFVYALHTNLGIFGEWNQLLERVLHVIDLKKLWSKLRLCNKTNFQKGAKNARVWASSLASVSLGESSSSRDL